MGIDGEHLKTLEFSVDRKHGRFGAARAYGSRLLPGVRRWH